MINGFNAIPYHCARLLNTMGAHSPIAIGLLNNGLNTEIEVTCYQIHFYSCRNNNRAICQAQWILRIIFVTNGMSLWSKNVWHRLCHRFNIPTFTYPTYYHVTNFVAITDFVCVCIYIYKTKENLVILKFRIADMRYIFSLVNIFSAYKCIGRYTSHIYYNWYMLLVRVNKKDSIW